MEDFTIKDLDSLFSFIGDEDLVLENSTDTFRLSLYNLIPKLEDLGVKTADFNIDMARDSRMKVSIGVNLTINFINLSAIFSSTIVLDITATADITLAWDSGTDDSIWVDGEVLTSILTGETYVLSINSNGNSKSGLLINYVKKGA